MKQEAVILMAEVGGFQKLVEELSPEDLSMMMNELHTLFETTTKLHHGTINRFSGDSVLVVFNNQTKKSGAYHALDAAFELKELLPNKIKTDIPDQPLSLKMAITKGQIVKTTIGTASNQQTTLMGEPLNHAGRICQFAEPNQILVDEGVFKTSSDHFEFQSLEPIPLKGGTVSLAIFEPLKKKRKKLDLKAASERKIVSEMVGRSKEMEQLEGLIRNLITGKGSIINIVGKAGIGKSRLMAEMKVQPIMEKIVMLEGRAQSTGQNLSFHPITNLIKSWAEIAEDDLPSVSSEKLQQSISRIASESADEIYAFLATMMGLPLEGKYKERVKGIEGEALEKLILKNLRDLIIAATQDKPRIYLIEDMHWADSSSITMFESLYKLARDYPVMFINVMRPGYKETGDYILKYLVDNFPGFHMTIYVNPLAEKESGDLIKNLLRETLLPGEVRQMIIRKTEGNPFFIEEIIRSFIDEGIIEVEKGHFKVTEEINDVNIPETINDAIISRIDKLDEKTKELLKTASAIGRNFYFKVLEEAADTIGELDERLQYLKEVQLINEGDTKDEIEYLFKHALAQQATYDSILKESRSKLHLKIARSIEKVFAENLHEFYGTLAYHYEMAENYLKTEEYLIKAGEESLRSGAPHEGHNYLVKGLDLYLTRVENNFDKKKLGEYYYKLSLACHSGGMNTEAITFIEKFQQIHNLDYPQKGLRLIIGLFWRIINFFFAINFQKYYFKQAPNELDDAMIRLIIAKGQSMVTITPKKVFIDMLFFSRRLVNLNLAKTQLGYGIFMEYSGIFIWTGISKSIGRKIIEIAARNISKERKVEWMKLCYEKIMLKLFSANFSVDPNEDEIFDIGLKSGAFWETTTYLMFSCYVYIEKGNWARSKEIRKRLLETADIFENDHSRVQYFRMSGIALMKFRRLDEAIQNSDQGMEMIAKTGHEAILMLVQCSRILALTLKNNLEEAEIYLKKAEKVAIEKKRGVIFYSTFLTTKSYYLLAAFDGYAKEEVPNKLKVELLKTTYDAIKYSKKYAGNLTEAYRLRAIALLKLNKPNKALGYFEKALETGMKSGGNLELSRAYFETGKFLSDTNNKYNNLNGHSADHYLEKAKSMFEEMDLQWDWEVFNNFIKNHSSI